MRKRMAGHKLGRTTAHRTATLRNLAAGLFEHGQITTTIPRARAVQPFVEKIITKAKRGSLHARRQVIAELGGNRTAFEWLLLPPNPTSAEAKGAAKAREQAEIYFDLPDTADIKRNRYGELKKAPKLVKHIFDEVAPRYAERPGGYTRIVRLGKRRKGDGGELCVLQLVGEEEGPEIGGRPSGRRRTADRRTAFAAKLRKQAPAAAKPAEEATTEDES